MAAKQGKTGNKLWAYPNFLLLTDVFLLEFAVKLLAYEVLPCTYNEKLHTYDVCP